MISTQTKENIYSQYLFLPSGGSEDSSLWAPLIDTTRSFNFEVETNFTYIQLKQIDHSINSSTSQEDIAALKA